MSTRKKIAACSVLFLVVVLVAYHWQAPKWDIQKVHPAIRELAEPYQAVGTAFYLDGGSISIWILDKNGHRLELALPVSSSKGKRVYSHLFIGAKHRSLPDAMEVEFSQD